MSTSTKRGQAEFIQWMPATLDALRELGGSGKAREVIYKIAEDLKIPDSKLEETIKSGALRFENQVQWARQYLVWEGLLESSIRGTWALTPIGRETNLTSDQAYQIARKWSSAFASKPGKTKTQREVEAEVESTSETPIESGAEITSSQSLLETLQSVTPKGFEDICQLLLREHGFENVQVTQASHDGGIDGYGTLELNPFVTIKVLFQCKRYKGTVARAHIGDFRSAMMGRAEKGIILTTGIFSEDAKREASREGATPIELIDGQKLVSLFESIQLGVKQRMVYDVNLAFFQPYMDNNKV
jgi:restriction system protein